MNCHLPDAPDEVLTAVGFPPDSRIITQHGGRFPPHAPLTETGAGGGAGAAVVGGGGGAVVVVVVGAAVVGGVTAVAGAAVFGVV